MLEISSGYFTSLLLGESEWKERRGIMKRENLQVQVKEDRSNEYLAINIEKAGAKYTQLLGIYLSVHRYLRKFENLLP